MFNGFTLDTFDTGEAQIRVRHGGSGPPLLLLHGHPQTHVMWHRIAPRLAEQFTVVMPDLRGYGDSIVTVTADANPPAAPDHTAYSKRAMARDQISVMRQLGFDQFAVAGHDRGGRCAYRLAPDHPHAITRLAVLDIIPTGEAWRRANMEFGLGYWHWFFLAQPFPLPEDLLTANPDAYYFRGNRELFDPQALREYLRCVHNPATIHTMCQDYRAGATIDYQLDEQDRGVRRIQCPVLVLWGKQGSLEKWYDVLAIWRDWATDVRGTSINSGHYLPEQAPDETYAAFHTFFSE